MQPMRTEFGSDIAPHRRTGVVGARGGWWPMMMSHWFQHALSEESLKRVSCKCTCGSAMVFNR